MKRPATIQRHLDFPTITDIFDVVPLPFTEEIAAPDDISVEPNALRLVRRMGGIPPSFPDHPHTFTIPGHTLEDAKAFVSAMQATILWTGSKKARNDPGVLAPGKSKPTGQQTENLFKLEYRCPRSGTYEPAPNSRKKVGSRKCGCLARFTITHHWQTNSLRVVWHWDHNHDPYSLEDMDKSRMPKVVEKWLDDRVVSGMGWNAIQKLLNCPDLFAIDPSVAIAESPSITYDHVRTRIRNRAMVLAKKHSNVFRSIEMWNRYLISQGWNTYLPFQEDSEYYTFAFQSPWQREMMLTYGQSMVMVDATHNSVSNYCFNDGRKVSLYTIIIRDPVVGKGLPVCWAFTSSEAT
ncbi:hypothetical protein PGT21_024402 [Puccinia graminis f. sp. tritici]|uniref:MULE transposase domain-containing protein n=1 Tax=Puccinia graminis f. sp. tritici TaxID=56615 RepID=A0A5B0MT76_PUCGR|nr:hypothetical protein PGT21_024402 [Puccinia graminis f. sp. tritici]